MGDPTYEAIRARERAEAEREKAFADATRAALEGVMDFFNGRATIVVTPTYLGSGASSPSPISIRFVRDPK